MECVMHHSPKPTFDSLAPSLFERQGRTRPACGSAWGLIAERLSDPQPSLRLATASPAPARRRETVDQSSFSMSGFG